MKWLYVAMIFAYFTFFIHSNSEINYLFINTIPIRAKVYVDGKESRQTTPCIIKASNLELKEIVLKKDHYKEYVLSHADKKSRNLELYLTPVSFELFFPQKNRYRIGNTDVKGPVYLAGLHEGNYRINFNNNHFNFKRITAFTPAEAALGTALGISFASMITTIALSEYYAARAYQIGPQNQVDYNFFYQSNQNLNTAKYIAIGVTSALAVALTTVVTIDLVTRARSKKQSLQIVNKLPSTQDDQFYETAMQFLSSGEIKRSIQVLLSILSLYPESERVAHVYYQLGQNYFINNDFDNALKYWEIFLRDYPLAEYYDYVLKNIADIYYIKNDFEKARNLLNRVVFTDNILNKEAFYSLRAKIDFELFQQKQAEEYYHLAVLEYQQLITDFSTSEQLDVYFSMLIKLYKLKGDDDKINELKDQLDHLSNVDDGMKILIQALFK